MLLPLSLLPSSPPGVRTHIFIISPNIPPHSLLYPLPLHTPPTPYHHIPLTLQPIYRVGWLGEKFVVLGWVGCRRMILCAVTTRCPAHLDVATLRRSSSRAGNTRCVARALVRWAGVRLLQACAMAQQFHTRGRGRVGYAIHFWTSYSHCAFILLPS